VLALPTEAAAEVALRTQQVLLEETGVASVIDPLGGSWFVEASTDRLDAEVEALLTEIEALGDDGTMTSGIVAGIETGWFTRHIADAAEAFQRDVDLGDRRVVGVNVHRSTVSPPLEVLRVSQEVEHDQVRRLAERRKQRDRSAVDDALASMATAARGSQNLVPPMLDAVRAEVTVGEICDVLREVFGGYTEPPEF
jgi:methylmalonyl-CoA mutase N-terminal domain/subunit